MAGKTSQCYNVSVTMVTTDTRTGCQISYVYNTFSIVILLVELMFNLKAEISVNEVHSIYSM